MVIPEDVTKLHLLGTIRQDKPILIPFRVFEFHELPQLTPNAKHETWAVKVDISSPNYICIAFQTEKRNDIAKDPTHYDNLNISDVRVILNGEYYPLERHRLDFKKNDYAEAFNN